MTEHLPTTPERSPLERMHAMHRHHTAVIEESGIKTKIFEIALTSPTLSINDIAEIQDSIALGLGVQNEAGRLVYVLLRHITKDKQTPLKLNMRAVNIGLRLFNPESGEPEVELEDGFTMEDFVIVESLYDQALELKSTFPTYNTENGLID